MASSVVAMRTAPAAAPQSPARESPRCRSSFVAGSGSAFRTGSSVLRMTAMSHQRQAPRQVTRMGLFGLGVPELALVAGAAALLFGPAKIPQLGQALGKTAKSVKAAADEFQKELQNTEGEADSGLSSTQKLKEKHPAAGEGEDVRGVE